MGGPDVKLVLRPRFARSGGPGHDELGCSSETALLYATFAAAM